MTIIQKIEQAIETDTPQGIVDFLQKRNGLYSKDHESRYSVTELVGCKRKSHYKQLGVSHEELLEDSSLESMWATVRGDFLHNMTYAYKWRELDIEYPVSLPNRIVNLVGRLDMYDWKTKTIIDLKTTKFVRWQIKQGFIPKLEHILQVQCYDTMFSKYLPVENLNIVYADMSDIVTYKIQKQDMNNWIKNRINEIETSKISKQIPNGETSGLCKYCPYQTKCFEDGNGLIDKPLSIPKSLEESK